LLGLPQVLDLPDRQPRVPFRRGLWIALPHALQEPAPRPIGVFVPQFQRERSGDPYEVVEEPTAEARAGRDGAAEGANGPGRLAGAVQVCCHVLADEVAELRQRRPPLVVELVAVGDQVFDRVELSASRLLVWRAPQEKRAVPFGERVEELVEKVGAKLAQTRREDEPRRIVVVTIPEALAEDYDALHLTEYDSVRLMDEIHRRLVAKHDRVATLMFVIRVWTSMKRNQYRGFFLLGEEQYAVPDEFIDKLQELDGQTDFLQDWE
jgi:hypothetical protein